MCPPLLSHGVREAGTRQVGRARARTVGSRPPPGAFLQDWHRNNGRAAGASRTWTCTPRLATGYRSIAHLACRATTAPARRAPPKLVAGRGSSIAPAFRLVRAEARVFHRIVDQIGSMNPIGV